MHTNIVYILQIKKNNIQIIEINNYTVGSSDTSVPRENTKL